MKKMITFVLVVMMIFSFIQNCFASGDNITIVLNGETVQTDVSPFILGGRTMVPARAIFEKMGADVQWDGARNRVTVTSPGNIINLTVGNNVAMVNGASKELDTAPVITGGRTFVPIRFISENLGFKVDWNDINKIVYISAPSGNTTGQGTVPPPVSDNNQTTPPYDDSGSSGAVMSSVAVTDVSGGVEVSVKLSSANTPRIMTLDNPYRIVFDFYGVVQNFKNSSHKPVTPSVVDVRWGRHTDYARIVVECQKPMNYKVTFNPGQCLITVSESLTGSSVENVQPESSPNKSETVTVPEVPSYIDGSPLVYLDPGHGGHDTGAIGRDEAGNTVVVEKDANLTISIKVRDLLAASGVNVKMTRETDVALGTTQMEDLVTRASLANAAGAVLYISIHNNSFGDPSATGTTVLHAGLSSGGEYGISGENLAQNIQDFLVKATGLKDRGIVKSPEMVVLKRTSMPAVIVECAFVSCPVDQKVLTNPAKVDAIAYAIYQGIMTSLAQMKG